MGEKINKELIITGCHDCPMCDMNDMCSGYSCRMIKGIKEDKHIEDSKQFQPITPKWCPIKKQSIIFKFKTI